MRCDAYMVGLEFGRNAAGKSSFVCLFESVQNSSYLRVGFYVILFIYIFLFKVKYLDSRLF